jgi:hypothetical protein
MRFKNISSDGNLGNTPFVFAKAQSITDDLFVSSNGDLDPAALVVARSLLPALQDRALLQAGSAPDRFVHLTLLDGQHEAAAPQQRQSASPSSELVVATALRQSLPEFLLNTPQSSIFTKFVTERQDTNKMQAFRLAA